MHYRSNFFTTTILKLLVVFLALFAVLVFTRGTAHAAAPIPSKTLPESSDFSQGNNVWLTVARADGVNYLLDATTSVVRIYSGSRTVSLTITNGGHCPGNGPDAGASEGQAQTLFSFEKLKYSPTYDYKSAPYVDDGAAAASVTSAAAGCGTYNLTLNNDPANNVPATEQGYAQNGTYAFEVRATWQTLGAYGWNQFKLSVDTGRLSYYAGSGDKFALKAANSACSPYVYPGCTGTFRMGFAPNCKLSASDTTTVTIQWFDADAGQPNQGGDTPVKTQFIEYDAANAQTAYDVPIANIKNTTTGGSGGTAPGNGNLWITTGNSQHGSATITIRGHHKYAWVWSGIHTANGIQFQLPTDSYNTLIDFNQDCGSQNLNATCTANGLVNYSNTGSVSITYKFTNTGPTGWTTSQSPSIQHRRYVNGAAFSPITIPNNVASGGSFSITVNETAPATGKKIIKYTMWQSGVGVFGSPCTATLSAPTGGCTSNCGGGGGSISVSCSNITISGVNSSATQSATTGVSQIIKRVPVVLRLTADDGTTYSWIVNNGGNYGIPNQSAGGSGGNSFPISTYGIPGINFTMYPHQSYTVELAVEGIPASNSATYQDNGWWNPTNNANDAGFYYGIQIVDTETTPTDCLTAQCGGTSSVDAEPGQLIRNLQAGIQFNNKTSASFPTTDPAAYQMILNTSGGLKPSNVRYDNIAANATNTSNINFDAEIDYTGYYSVSLYFKGQPLDIGNQVPCPTQQVRPRTRAFIEVTGGDIVAGGSFKQGTTCSNKVYPYYISPATTPGNSPNSGGIATYGNQSTGLGSKAQFGVLSLGYNVGSFSGPGLFSVDRVGGTMATLSNLTGQNGGLLNQTGTSDWHCAPDYYDTTQKTGADAPGPFGGGGVPPATAQYKATGPISISTSTIGLNQQTTIYVDGDVTITGNITYTGSYDATVPTKIPYFVLIAKGNISIDPAVTQLDGLYVSQLDPATGKGGVFATCIGGLLCNQQLKINGAVLAQEVDLLREHGTQGPLSADPNGICTPTGSSNCPPAEIFNFIPAMILGQPNFAPAPSNLKSLFSLPPVF
jgi:hypothetical protein